MGKLAKITANMAAGLLLLSPFFVLRSLLYPFVLGKATVIQIVVALSLPFLAVFIFSERRLFFKKGQWITLALCAYAAMLILSSAAGISPWQSFWGTSDRGLGIFGILHILAAYFIFLAALRQEKSRRLMILLAVCVGFTTAILGISEYFKTGGSRVMGFFGNPIFFGSYLLFPLFFSVILLLNAKSWKRIIFFVIFITVLLSFFFAQSRGALAGAIVGGIVAAVALVWSNTGNKKHIVLKIAVIACVATALIFVLAKSGNRQVLSLIGRFTEISIKDASSDQRLRLSVVAFKAAGDRPMLGWGPENFDYAFDRNYDPGLLKYGVSETWVDRSHNTYLDTLVTSGILGLASYIFIFIAAFIMLRRSIKSGKRTLREAGMLGALLAAYGVANFFSFDSLPSLIYFMFLLAYISAPVLKADEEAGTGHKPGANYAVLAAGVIISLASIVLTVRNARAARHMLVFTNLPPAASGLGLAEIEQVVKINPPLLRDFRLRFANKSFEEAEAMSKEDAKNALSAAIAQMERNVQEAPGDFSYRYALGNLFLERGILFGAEDYQKAEEAYKEAIPYSPGRQSVYFQLASVNFLQRDFAEAIKILGEAVSFDPTLGQPHWRLGIGYAYNGEVPRALAEWKTALWNGDKPEIAYYKTRTGKGDVRIDNINFAPNIKKEREFVLNISLRERDFDIFRVLTILSIESVAGEAKGALYAQLAVAELEAGNFSGARDALARAVEYDPSARSEAEMFLLEITSREQSAGQK